MASRVFHLSGLQLDQATSGAYYALIVWGTGLVRNTGEQPISGVKTFYDSAFFLNNVNVGGDFAITGDVVGTLEPKTDNLYNLGSTSKEWRNVYCDGTGWFDTLIVDENLTVATGLSVSGSTTIGGSLSVGSNSTITGNLNVTGNFTVTGDFLPKNIATHFLPKTNNLYDLGSLSSQFKNAYFGGFVQTDDLIVDQSASVASNLTVSGNSSVIGDSTIGRLFISGTGIPTGTGAIGTRGQFAVGSGHLYICTGTNAWGRTHLTGWT
jgi:predicted acyltransferase (DUF342 family)